MLRLLRGGGGLLARNKVPWALASTPAPSLSSSFPTLGRARRLFSSDEAAGGCCQLGSGNSNAVFTNIDIRVGQIKKAWEHAESTKLWCELVEVGEQSSEEVEIASGLRAFYPSRESLEERMVLVVRNLKPAKLAGFTSHGMLLCAQRDGESVDGETPEGGGSTVELIEVMPGTKVGERVWVDSITYTRVPCAPANRVKKKKLWEELAKDLKTDEFGMLTWQGKPVRTTAGPCFAPTCANSPVS